jgi:pimeloyl-ACP methyl ester carboxylesterase
MPFAIHRGQRICYGVRGEGPTVILQHGLFSRGSRWQGGGFVDGLATDHRVVWVDSLGHGDSDKPGDATLYSRRQRAGDLAAVLDAVGAERAHLVGYSLGGWMAAAVAMHHPERLRSLVIGGWDPAGAMRVPADRRPTIDVLLASVALRVPGLVDWVTPEVRPALSACWDALLEIDGAEEALAALRCPVMLGCGVDDECHRAMQLLSDRHGFELLSTPGDHAGAMVLDTANVVACWRRFFERARADSSRL